MPRLLAVSICAVCFSPWPVSLAAAQGSHPKTRAVVIHSLGDYDACRRTHADTSVEPCLEALRAFAKKNPRHAFQAAKRVSRDDMPWTALALFADAFAGRGAKHAAKWCRDADLESAVLSGLALPPHYPAVATARKLVTETCREALEQPVIVALDESGGHFRSNACPLVSSKVRDGACDPLDERAAAPAPAPELPSLAERMAIAPTVREVPPPQETRLTVPPAPPLADVFPATGASSSDASSDEASGAARERAEFFRGPHGEELMIARTGDHAAVLRFKGIGGPWNERALVATERDSAVGKDYVVELNGREAVVVIERQGQYQAFPRGVKGGIWLNALSTPPAPGELRSRRKREAELATAPHPGK